MKKPPPTGYRTSNSASTTKIKEYTIPQQIEITLSRNLPSYYSTDNMASQHSLRHSGFSKPVANPYAPISHYKSTSNSEAVDRANKKDGKHSHSKHSKRKSNLKDSETASHDSSSSKKKEPEKLKKAKNSSSKTSKKSKKASKVDSVELAESKAATTAISTGNEVKRTDTKHQKKMDSLKLDYKSIKSSDSKTSASIKQAYKDTDTKHSKHLSKNDQKTRRHDHQSISSTDSRASTSIKKRDSNKRSKQPQRSRSLPKIPSKTFQSATKHVKRHRKHSL